MKRIYLSPPDVDGREKELLVEALESNWVTTLGPQVDAFESEMCKKIGVGHATAMASGTGALHLSLLTLDVGPNDVVFCSDFTFAATANAIIYCGAIPVFIDSDRETWNMDPNLLAEEMKRWASNRRVPKAIIAVDVYGQCADYRNILSICNNHDVPVIEDAAEALGAICGGKQAGSFGEMAILSFNGNKIITTSGGGMLVSNKEEYIKKAHHLATQARDPFPYYEHSSIGYNYRLSNLLAAVGRGQLENLDRKVSRRREINQFYRQALADLPGIEFMPEAPYGRSTFWLTCITIDPEIFGARNEDIRLFLEAHNIESRHVWKPMHMQPVFAKFNVVRGNVTEDLFARGLCLPSGSGLLDVDLERICDLVHEVHKKNRHSSRQGSRA